MIALQANVESRRRVLRLAAELQALAWQSELPDALDELSFERSAADDGNRSISYRRLPDGTVRLAIEEVGFVPDADMPSVEFSVILSGAYGASRSDP